MDIQSAFYSGLQGMQRASTAITEATQEINRQTTANPVVASSTAASVANEDATTAAKQAGLTASLVQLNQQEVSAQANVKVINAADEVLGTTIDVRV